MIMLLPYYTRISSKTTVEMRERRGGIWIECYIGEGDGHGATDSGRHHS